MDQESYQITQMLDGLPVHLQHPEDFSWLQKYGRVFHVWDEQMSGNLCFGVEGFYGKLFIKYAGARPLRFQGDAAEAALQLYRAMPLYERKHPALVELLAHGPVGNGYAAVFAWQEGIPLKGPRGEDNRIFLRKMNLWQILSMLDGVYDLHQQLAQEGYIAVDFYDGNLVADAATGVMRVCDIDLYRKKPAVNDRGRMQGSSRFMSPEEFQLGAALTESTTVFNLGALAFEMFGDNLDRSRRSWTGPKELFPVAEQATQPDPMKRYATVRAFLAAWRRAVKTLPQEKNTVIPME